MRKNQSHVYYFLMTEIKKIMLKKDYNLTNFQNMGHVIVYY